MMIAARPNLDRLRRFVLDFAGLLSGDPPEARILSEGSVLLGRLVGTDDWLPDEFATTVGAYSQHLLHCDSRERFSVVSFVWGPNQGTPIHNHTVWGLVGVLRGLEIAQPFFSNGSGLEPGVAVRLGPGQVEAVSPSIGDIHRVTNGLTDRPSVSIHVYGGNIGRIRRSVFDERGEARAFVSGYSNVLTPNLWRESPLPA